MMGSVQLDDGISGSIYGRADNLTHTLFDRELATVVDTESRKRL